MIDQFIEITGRRPEGVWAAPGRVNLIGEHTDYNDGYVLPAALAQRTVVTAGRGPPGRWRAHSLARREAVQFGVSELVPGGVAGWGAYVAGVVWALVEAGHEVSGAEMVIDSDVPVGAGLSSSAAIECAVLAALIDLGGLDVPITERPAIAQRAENDYVGVPSGIMDQAASVLSRAGHALFLDCRSGRTEHVPLGLADHDLALLVVDSRARHRLADSAYAERRSACEAAARELGVPALRDVTVTELESALAKLDHVARGRVRHVVTENARVLDAVACLWDGNLRAVGPLLTASHVSLRDDYDVSTVELDAAVEAAMEGGAHGARLTGGGFGGSVVVLVDRGRSGAVVEAVVDAFAARGFERPEAFAVMPSPGATRLL
ncbi:MAG: galactokinase [Acidimicrobiales bacterium]